MEMKLSRDVPVKYLQPPHKGATVGCKSVSVPEFHIILQALKIICVTVALYY